MLQMVRPYEPLRPAARSFSPLLTSPHATAHHRPVKSDVEPEYKRSGLPWLAEESARLRAGWLGGTTLQALTELLERSIDGVTSHLRRMGLVQSRSQAKALATASGAARARYVGPVPTRGSSRPRGTTPRRRPGDVVG